MATLQKQNFKNFVQIKEMCIPLDLEIVPLQI